jgi:hypothetical protein
MKKALTDMRLETLKPVKRLLKMPRKGLGEDLK